MADTLKPTYKVEKTATEYVIHVRLDGDEGMSASGKTRIIASSHGGLRLDEGVTLNLNVYRKV